MAQSYEFLPDGDIENDGWTVVGGSATTVSEVWYWYEDDCYVRCPAYRGGAEVKFPFDYSSQFPQGAIIDSITVMIRMVTNSGSGARGVTVNMLSSDNRSRYTTRTIYATGTLPGAPDWGVEVGTYTRDPLGRAWDIQRLNKLRLRVFSHNNLADSVRIYGLWVKVNFHTKPTVAVTSPTGTVSTPSPLISWTYSQQEGEPQKTAEYKIFTLTQASASTFNPSTAEPIYGATVSGIANEYTLPTSINANDYVVYVRSQSQFGAWSDWAHKQFTVSAPAPGIPGDNNAGVAGVPGVGVPTVVPDNYTSSTAIRMQDSSNLLSVQQADFEIASDPLGYVGDNATLARDTLHAFASGIASMKITTDLDGDASAVSTMVEVSPSQPVTVVAQFLAGDDTGRTVDIVARFLDENYQPVAGDIVGTSPVSDLTWTEVSATGSTPADAKYCEVVAWIEDSLAGEVHYVDHVGLMYGTNTAWSDGGHTSRNMLTSFLATGDEPESAVDAWVQQNTATTLDRVAVSGEGAHGEMCNRMTYVGTPPSIEYRAKSTVWTSPTSGSDFQLNKPSDPVAPSDNDLLIAFVTSTEFGTINPPAGWTAVNTAAVDDGSTDVALWVLKRTALATDPPSWSTGTLSAAATRRSAVVVAYQGAAHADEQFIADAVRTDSSGALVHRTAEVVNTDPNAWRVAAFAANDDHGSLSMTANTTAPGTAAPIAYVGKSSSWSKTSETNSFTINKPSGVQAGDVMIASVAFSGIITASTPTGWNVLPRMYTATSGDAHSGDITTYIFWRKATASEPNSWTANHTGWAQPKLSQVVAYRNVDGSNPFIDTNYNSNLNRSSVSTGSVTNTDSRAWRLCMFSALTRYGDTWSGGDSSERADVTTSRDGFPDPVISFSDSNGMVSTGSHSRSAAVNDGSYFSAVGWIGLLRPLSVAATPGADETRRINSSNGGSPSWLGTAVFDSNGEVGTGAQSVYGILTTSDSGAASSMASWVGIIKPAASTEGGTAAATLELARMIDVGDVSDDVFELAGNKLTMMASFLGSSSGTPTLTAEFYRANQLIGRQSAAGQTFNTTTWTKSWAVFTVPEGTTRIRPVLSALDRGVDDTVDFDKVAVMFGSLADPTQEPQWRNGTARPEHPVWSKPVIQYQENDGNGYGEWQLLAGQKTLPPKYDLNTSQMSYVDHTIVPLNSRRYRVATLSYGLNGDIFASGYGPASQEAIFEPRAWWLKDIQDLSKNTQIAVRWKDMQVDTANMATSFQPIGTDYPVVVTEGFKGDSFSLEIHCEQAEFTALMKLLNSGRTLILQSDIDKMWWVRPVGNIAANILATSSRQERPRRYVSVTFIQVAPEE